MPENDVLIEIKDLHTQFELAEGTVRAVDGADLVIERGRTLGVVGESGCGKSVTALSLMQLVPWPGKITGGEITYYKAMQQTDAATMSRVVNITGLKPDGKEMRTIRGNHISMVFQEPMTAMSPVRTVGRQIMEVIELHRGVRSREAKEMAIDMLARVGLPHPDRIVDNYPFELSGGMRQRCVIAMALSCDPSLLIADEPTTALDVTTEAQILDLMRSLQDELGMAIMYITHNLGVIAEMAERVAVMYLGKVVEQASVSAVFNKPLHPYTRALLRSIPHLDDAIAGDRVRLEVIRGMVPDPYTCLNGCCFHPRCPEAIEGTCNKVEPQIIPVEEGHTVRCHLYTES